MGIEPAIDITPEQHRMILASLNQHLPGIAAWAYGSRVKGTSRPQSDLDMVVFATPEQEMQVENLREALEESDLPFRVDLFVWNEIPESFREQIEAEHAVIVATDQSTSATSRSGAPWQEVQFSDCARLIKDTVSPLALGDTPYVGLEHIGEGTLSLVSIGTAHDVKSAKTRFRVGDILFGKLRPYFRKLIRPRFNGICSTDIWVIRPTDQVCANYLFYTMASHDFVDAATQGSEGTKMPRAKWDYLAGMKLLLPPLGEQRAIAHILGTLDDKIELNRRMNETLEATARAIFKDWFVDFGPTRAKAEGRPPYLPPNLWNLFPKTLDNKNKPLGWVKRRLEDFLKLVYGKSLPAKSRRPGKATVYGSGGPIGTHDTALIDGPAVVVGRKGTVGSLYWEDGPIFPIDTVFYVVPLIGSILFSYHLLATQPLRDMNTDAAVPGLNRGNAYRLEFPQPTSELVSAFEGATSALWQQRAKNLGEIEVLSRIRDVLLPKLMSGEIRLRDAERLAETVG